MEPAKHSAFPEENKRLKQTLDEMKRQLEQLLAIPRYTGDNPTEQVLESIRDAKRRNLKQAMPEPYFGRLDFQEAGHDAPIPLYIGKLGVEKEDSTELLVIDWRAPVASLFYSFTGGTAPARYESLDGPIEGTVHLKRNLVVRNYALQRVVDTYDRNGDQLAVSDEFLLHRLGENKDNRLRDIVSTIQAEQDAIIRSGRSEALVVQGVAGSGKTTVALHRIAYLLYQYREQMRAEKIIIFAPNRMFLDYISGVLPELGVGHIQQTTFADWALELLVHEVALADPAERLKQWFDRPDSAADADFSEAPGRIKGSIRFMHSLDALLDAYEAAAVPEADFVPWPGAELKRATIRHWYHTEYKHEPVMKRRDRVLARIKRWLEMELDQFRDPRIRKERKKQGSQRLREYAKRWTAYTPFAWYRELFREEGPSFAAGEAMNGPLVPDKLRRETEALARKKRVQPEDLAPLIHIRNRFYGIDGQLRFDHTVIDEAQDYSPLQIALLMQHTRSGSFTILGDLAQGIHAYQGVHRWDEMLELFPEEQRGYYTLSRSYRSTMEIIRFANGVLQRGMADPPEPAVPVFRSGAPVELVRAGGAALAAKLAGEIAAHRAGGEQAGTLAVLCRTEARCRELHAALAKAGCEANLIVPGQQQYEGGVSIMPVYLAKGLEFDTALIVDADPDAYPATPHAAKLLYVGCTRALHSLKLYYGDAPSPLVADIEGDYVARAV